MLYLQLSEEHPDQLFLFCHHCHLQTPTSSTESMVVSRVHLRPSKQSFGHLINDLTKYDPTLPRVSTLECPSPHCPTHHATAAPSREVVFIRYDSVRMKYVNLCCRCDHVWKADS
jgi:hypothetical protein